MKQVRVERGIFKLEGEKENPYLVLVSVRNPKTKKRHYRQQRVANITLARTTKSSLIQELRTSITKGPSLTLVEFVRNHFYPHFNENSSPSAYKRSVSVIEANIIKSLGNRKLTEITTKEIHDLLRIDASPLSSQSRRHILSHFRRIFKTAILFEFAVHNPADAVPTPKVKRKPPLVLSESDLKKLLSYLRENQPVMFYYAFLAVRTLARAGELRALTWADVDFERDLIDISKTDDPKTGLKDCPKNGEARKIPIDPETRAILLELRQLTYKTDSDLVLPHWREFAGGEQGKPLKLILSALGLTPIRWHDLRATGITLMLTKRTPHSVIMKISGHRSISSFNIYVRLAGVEVKGETDHIKLLDTDEDDESED
jgi:integrase